MKTKPLTKKEEEIMRVFWEQPGPLGLVSLSRVLPEYNLNTMQVVLRKLKNTGFIKPVGVEDNGKTGTRTYAFVWEKPTTWLCWWMTTKLFRWPRN